VATTRGASSGDFTSMGIGFEYLPAKVKFTTLRAEAGRRDDTHVLITAGPA
jgi:spore coat polysaccharide biosynthesis predicted glycosyltransferase SpsG